MGRLLRRLRARLRYRHFAADLDTELAQHRAMAEAAHRENGATREAARTLASRQLGNVTLAREASRGAWLAPWLESLWQDASYAVRALRHSRAFTGTALVTLMLGVGLNTTLFSFLNALLLRPWNVPDAGEVVVAYHRLDRNAGEELIGISAVELAYLTERATTVSLAGIRNISGELTQAGVTSVQGRLVTGNYFNVLRLPIVTGRALQESDDVPAGSPAIVLSHELWRTQFASDPAVVGQTTRLLGRRVTIVGVAGASAGGAQSPLESSPDFWIPVSAMSLLFPEEAFAREFLVNAGHCCVDLVGRLRPGFDRAAAEAELSTLDRQFRGDARDGRGMRVTNTATMNVPEASKMLPVFGLLVAGAALVLLLTTANVGNLQLARAAARRQELSVRLALGASRARVVRQLLTEGCALAALAVILCLTISSLAARTIVVSLDPALAALDFSMDARTLAVAVFLTLATCLLTSLAPALRGTKSLVTTRSAKPALRLRSTFLAAQVAATIVLLSTASLLTRALTHAAGQDVGFRLTTLELMRIERVERNSDTDARDVSALLDAIRGSSSTAVAIAALAPLGDESLHTGVRRAGEPYEADRPARFQPVSSNFFSVLDIPIREGRTFNEGANDEVVLNETLARTLFPDGGAVGSHLAGANGTVGRRVVGVVRDANLAGLGRVQPTLFQRASSPNYVLFHKGETASDAVAALVSRAMPDAEVSVQPVGDNVGTSLEAASTGARAAGALGLLALAVSAVGIAGVFHFVVAERTREIGIRLALGSSRGAIRQLVLTSTGTPIALGIGVGLVAAFLSGEVLRGYLYGLSPSDPVTYVATGTVVFTTAWVAALAPVRRALSIDPATTLRRE